MATKRACSRGEQARADGLELSGEVLPVIAVLPAAALGAASIVDAGRRIVAAQAKRFREPPRLKDRVDYLPRFIFNEIERASGERRVHQEMTLYARLIP